MRGHIEEHPDYASKIYNNPIEILKAIKDLMYNTIRAQSPVAVMMETILRLININQQEDSLLDYVKRFKQQCEIFVSQIGKRFLDSFVEQLEEYRTETNATKQLELKKRAFDRWLAYLVMKGADWTKYGVILKQIVTQYSLGNDQYPKTLTHAISILSDHKFDLTYQESRKKKQNNAKDKDKEQGKEKKDKDEMQTELNFAQLEGSCYCCGKKGHWSPQCNKKDKIPRSEWAINKTAEATFIQAASNNQSVASLPATTTPASASSSGRRSQVDF